MHIHIVSIFPDIFKSFTETSLIKKAQEKKILSFTFINPRIFCPGRHQQVDDTIYGGGAGLLMKAQPAIEAVESIIQANVPLDKGGKQKGGFGKTQSLLSEVLGDFLGQCQKVTLRRKK